MINQRKAHAIRRANQCFDARQRRRTVPVGAEAIVAARSLELKCYLLGLPAISRRLLEALDNGEKR